MSYQAVGFDYFDVIEVDGHLDERLIALSDNLRAGGYKTGILSNATVGALNFTITPHFDVVHVSAQTGYAKPDVRAFTKFAAAMGVDPAELIFIDDTQRHLIAAGELGITSINYVGYDELIIQMQLLGLYGSVKIP